MKRDVTISEEQVQKNKDEFISLLESVERPGCYTKEFIEYISNGDFFSAPASTKFHNDVKGGLCAHCLNVYYNCKALVEMKGLSNRISRDSIILCSLLHDISKMGAYRETVKNKKVYSDKGSKFDALGKFDWIPYKGYETIEDENRFIYGNHEETAEYIASQYFPLTVEESSAILNHHGGIGYDSTQGGMAAKSMARYPISAILHLADCLSSWIDENEYEDLLNMKKEENE